MSLLSGIFIFQNIFIKNVVNMDLKELENEIINTGKVRGLNLNLDNPQTIQDKINWLKVYDITPLKGLCADKIKIHEYCKEKLGKDICIPILGIYNSVEEIDFHKLPKSFVIKCNHGYNMNIICRDKTKLNINDIKEKINKWLNTDFGKKSGQLHYSLIDRKVFVETLMEDEKQKDSLFDYKFWCFNGEPKLYTINNGNGHGDIVYYDMNDNVINPYKVKSNIGYKKPNKFKEMVEYAKILSSEFKFVRVDFYEVNNEIYLGELTFTPGNGFFKYKDEKYCKIFGDLLKI